MISKELEKRILSSIILIPISIFFIFQESMFFIFFLSLVFLVTVYEWLKMSKNINTKMLGIIFLLFSFYFSYLLRTENGFEFFLFVILISILTDIGGYIFGKIFKGPKLTKISPKKTYAGVIGSFILSVFGGLIFYENMTNVKDIIILNYISFEPYGINLNLFILFIILIISLISQLGDLTISYFKRMAKIKDTGKILPGHGGLLDRIDGIIFAVPIIYLILEFGGAF
jgi:phosphatidate cytidylyltransferase